MHCWKQTDVLYHKIGLSANYSFFKIHDFFIFLAKFNSKNYSFVSFLTKFNSNIYIYSHWFHFCYHCVQPCVSPNASSNSLPRRCIITVIALKRNVFDWFVISKRWNAVTQAGILKMQMLDTLGKALNEAWYGVLIMLKHIQSSWNFQKAHTQHTGVRHLIWDFVCE